MKNFHMEGFEERPKVDFNADSGILEISESSYPEYTNEIYSPVMEWLTQYLAEKGRNITFNFRMDYFNTSTSSRFQKIIDMLDTYHQSKKGTVKFNWYYEEDDVDMFEAGQDYAKDATAPFVLIPYEV